MSEYRISELADRTGFPASTLRYYEQVGLLATDRTPAGYRVYDEAAIARLGFIGRAKRLGFPLEEIRELVGVWDAGPCASVKTRLRQLLEAKSSEVTTRIAELTAFDTELARAHLALEGATPIGPCDDTCGCTPPGDDPTSLGIPRPWRPATSTAALPPAAGNPAVTCTLTGDDQTARAQTWAELLGRATGRHGIDGGTQVTFSADATLIGQLAELAVREQQCCPFFTFTLAITTTDVTLDVHAPAGAEQFVAALFGAAS